MKALATAVAILTVSAPGFAGESFIEDEPTFGEAEKSELHATTRHAIELSDEQMDGVIAAGVGTVRPNVSSIGSYIDGSVGLLQDGARLTTAQDQ